MRPILIAALLLLTSTSSVFAVGAIAYCRSNESGVDYSGTSHDYATEDEALAAAFRELPYPRAPGISCGSFLVRDQCAAFSMTEPAIESHAQPLPQPPSSRFPTGRSLPYIYGYKAARSRAEASSFLLKECIDLMHIRKVFGESGVTCVVKAAVCDRVADNPYSVSSLWYSASSLWYPAYSFLFYDIPSFFVGLFNVDFGPLYIPLTFVLIVFVCAQVRSFYRAGRHRLVHIAKNAALSVGLVIALLFLYVLADYSIPRIIKFVTGLSNSARILLGTVIAGAAILLLPHRFWRGMWELFTVWGAKPPSSNPADPRGSASESLSRSDPAASAEDPPPQQPAVSAAETTNLPAVVNPPPVMPPAQGIVLKLKRSERQSTFGSIIYVLDARVDAAADVIAAIGKHNLGSRLVYESEARQRHRANAEGHASASADEASGVGWVPTPGKVGMGLLKSAWKLGRAGVSAARASLALRITVNSLLSGVHVECKSMEELLEAEDAIRQAKANLEAYVATLATFDGREELV